MHSGLKSSPPARRVPLFSPLFSHVQPRLRQAISFVITGFTSLPAEVVLHLPQQTAEAPQQKK
eukprot:2646011-Rhodomonas_salina.1